MFVVPVYKNDWENDTVGKEDVNGCTQIFASHSSKKVIAEAAVPSSSQNSP